MVSRKCCRYKGAVSNFIIICIQPSVRCQIGFCKEIYSSVSSSSIQLFAACSCVLFDPFYCPLCWKVGFVIQPFHEYLECCMNDDAKNDEMMLFIDCYYK
jgi:hypothetical protein